MTHAEDAARFQAEAAPTLAALDAIPWPPRTTCAACGKTSCGHADAVFLGIIPHSKGPTA